MSRAIGYKVTEEAKAKIRAAALLRVGPKNNRWGAKLSEETKKKIGAANKIALKGKKQPASTVNKRADNRRGKKNTETAKKNQSVAALKKKEKYGFIVHPDTIKKSQEAQKLKIATVGFLHSPETRKKLSDSLKGEKSHLWKGGVTPANIAMRTCVEYKLWREAVYKRDNYTCQRCGKRRNLEAHHIRSFSKFPDLRFEVSNGQTLCVKCHCHVDKCRRVFEKSKQEFIEFEIRSL